MVRRATPEAINERRKQAMAEWQKPIEFYGKVIDENSNPVENAIYPRISNST
jgi:protocatechuate 3,4-dioxygenase beta subunit